MEKTLKEIRPTLVDALWSRVNNALEDGFSLDAEAYLDRLAKETPKDVEVYQCRAGLRCNHLLDYGGAWADYETAVSLAPSNTDILLQKGEFLEDMGFFNEACGCYNGVLAIDSKSAEALFARGRIKVSQGNRKGALTDFTDSIALDASDPEKYSRRGFLFLMLGMKKDATCDFEKSRELIEEQGENEDDNGEDDDE